MFDTEILYTKLKELSETLNQKLANLNHIFYISKPTPENMEKYRILEKASFYFYIGVFLRFTKSSILNFLGYIYYLQETYQYTKKKNHNFEYIFVSHITKSQIDIEKDAFFQNLPWKLSKDSSVKLIFLNGNRTPANKISFSVEFPQNMELTVIPKFPAINILLRYYTQVLRCLPTYVKQFIKSKKLDRKLVFLSYFAYFDRQSISNLTLKNYFDNLFDTTNLKKCFTTFEGNLFEHYILEGSKKNLAAKFYFYQHAPILVSQYGLYENIANFNENCTLLVSGEITHEFFAQILIKMGKPKIKVINVGSFKFSSHKANLDSEKRNILFAPEGTEIATRELLDLAMRVAVENNELNFIFRLHPSLIRNPKILRLIKNFPKNLKLSSQTLTEDISVSLACIYRSSSVGIEGGARGLIPIYFGSSAPELDPLDIMKLSHPRLYTIEDALIFFRNGTFNSWKNNQKILDVCNKYFNQQDFNKIFSVE